ncbi:uncharacterized protein LOC115211015 [Argonauta hians]
METYATRLRDFGLKIRQKVNVPVVLSSIAAVLMVGALVHQTSRISHLERRAINRNSSDWYSTRPPFFKPTRSPYYSMVPGAIYTQWGRRNCTSRTARTVYSGVVGGSYYTHTGGGSNQLCLHLTPQWKNYSGSTTLEGTIYGSEYELTKGSGIFPKRKYPLHDQNVPCSVCEIKVPSTTLMIPGRVSCPPMWYSEYSGYIMSAHYSHKGRNQYICVDGEPEGTTGGYKNENGNLLYLVKVVTGSIPSPPYIDKRELACVVCSKLFANPSYYRPEPH